MARTVTDNETDNDGDNDNGSDSDKKIHSSVKQDGD